MLESHRELPRGFADDMILNSPSPNIMNKMARSVLAMYSYDEHAEDLSLPNILRQSINLIAELPTMMVNAYQIKRRVYDRSSMYFHLPTPGQSTAEHILSTYRPDQKFTHEEARLLDLCLLVHADHGGGNCSTFTCRVLSSSGTDTYAAISAAIGALKGPKHGGANLKVMRQLDTILQNVADPENEDELREYLRKIMRRQAGDGSGLIYGIGHAVYTLSDPRAQILKEHARLLAYDKGFAKEYETLCAIERLAPQVFAEERRGPQKGLRQRGPVQRADLPHAGHQRGPVHPAVCHCPRARLVRPPGGGGAVCQPHHPPGLQVPWPRPGVPDAGGPHGKITRTAGQEVPAALAARKDIVRRFFAPAAPARWPSALCPNKNRPARENAFLCGAVLVTAQSCGGKTGSLPGGRRQDHSSVLAAFLAVRLAGAFLAGQPPHRR